MAVKVCPKCKEDNKESASVCISCSASLAGAELIGTLEAEKIVEPKMKVCPKCSERNDPGALKCQYCGSVLLTNTVSGKRYYVDSGSSSDGSCLLYIVTIIFPIVGLIVGGIYSLNDDPGKQDIGKSLLILGLVITVIEVILFLILFLG